jgi:hypothetical protein
MFVKNVGNETLSSAILYPTVIDVHSQNVARCILEVFRPVLFLLRLVFPV